MGAKKLTGAFRRFFTARTRVKPCQENNADPHKHSTERMSSELFRASAQKSICYGGSALDQAQGAKMNSEPQYETVNKFDRAYSGLLGGNSLESKPTTIEIVNSITGDTQTFIVQTIRGELGDSLVIKVLDKDGPVRIILPPRVTSTIARQSTTLSNRARSNASKRAMKARMAGGYVPKPPQRRGKKGKNVSE